VDLLDGQTPRRCPLGARRRAAAQTSKVMKHKSLKEHAASVWSTKHITHLLSHGVDIDLYLGESSKLWAQANTFQELI
jgi:hypothetical protein